MVLFKCTGGGVIIYSHYVDDCFCNVPPLTNLGSFHPVLLVFLGGLLYIIYDGVIGWYLFVSVYLHLIILV